MSERIYALLLRLYPSHFRAHYGEEALQLFRDRAREEPALRLWAALLIDLIRSVPRVHFRPAPAAAPASGLMFTTLESEAPPAPMIAFGALASVMLLLCAAALSHWTQALRPSQPWPKWWSLVTEHAPEFAVASIKPSTSANRPEIGNSNGRSHARNATLRMLIATAFQVPAFRISGGPKWFDSERFDIEARAGDPRANFVELRFMMQSLLEDKFHLRLHRETRISQVYSLATAKGGAKLTRSVDQTSPDAAGPSPEGDPPRGGALLGPGLLVANAASMSVLAQMLAPELERPVLDTTSLTGRYDIRLQWTPEFRPAIRAGAVASNASDLPGLFTALREQLGLELKPGRGPVEFLIVDSAEKPGLN
jgi:uncharacterized protein (TIGR03435 family)